MGKDAIIFVQVQNDHGFAPHLKIGDNGEESTVCEYLKSTFPTLRTLDSRVRGNDGRIHGSPFSYWRRARLLEMRRYTLYVVTIPPK